MKKLIIRANAKINLTLDITGKRADGYHLIDSVFQSVSAADIVEVQSNDKITVGCERFFGGDDINGEKNIAFKAAKEFFAFAGIPGGAKITIEKYIPVCAGLGGGSADAAAVIYALNSIYKTGLSREELTEIALKCGADVPFFLFGGTARVRGIGEEVEKLGFIGDFAVLIVRGGDKKSTADMYKKLDLMPDLKKQTDRFCELLEAGEKTEALKGCGNAFLPVQDDNGVLKLLSEFNPIAASLSGSGPSYFAVFENEKSALAAADELQKRGISSVAARFERFGIAAE